MRLKSNVVKVIIPVFIVFTLFAGFKLLSPNVVNIQASYSLYTDLDSLLSKTDTIVVGNVVNVGEGFAIDHNNYIVGEKAKKIISAKGKNLSVYTPCKIKVEQVLKGDLSVGDMIRVNQQGGTYENVYYNIEGIKIYDNNQAYVFFLMKRDLDTDQRKKDFKENYYLPVNPFQGQLSIQSDVVQLNTEINPMYESDSMSLDEFVELIKSHLD